MSLTERIEAIKRRNYRQTLKRLKQEFKTAVGANYKPKSIKVY